MRHGDGEQRDQPQVPEMRAQRWNATVTSMVTPKDGHPEHPGNKAKADVLSRPLDFRTQARRLLSVEDASAYLGISRWTMRGLGWNGEIPQVKIGRRVLFDREDLDAFVERSKR